MTLIMALIMVLRRARLIDTIQQYKGERTRTNRKCAYQVWFERIEWINQWACIHFFSADLKAAGAVTLGSG